MNAIIVIAAVALILGAGVGLMLYSDRRQRRQSRLLR